MSKYKFGKQTDALSLEDFDNILNLHAYVKPLIHRAFICMLYFTGARVSEILAITKKDFNITKETIYIKVKASKHGVKRGAFEIERTWPYAYYIHDAFKLAKKHERIFPFTRQTAWNIIKRVLPEKYPHYFRLNRCVHFLNDPEMTLNNIRQWFAWKSLDTVNNYLGELPETVGKMSKTVK